MRSGIAVVGMACRFADADSPEALWQTVLARRRAFRRMPAERLNLADYDEQRCDPADSIYPIEVAVLENYTFDRARHIVPGSAFAAADLTHWLALDVATEALADAALPGGGDHRGRTGVIVGNSLTGEFSRAGLMRYRWPYVRRQLDAALADEGFDMERRESFLAGFEARYKAPFPPPDEESLAGGLANTIAGRIANHHDLKGGGYTVDGACASSLLAVASACRRLESGEVDVVLAGGVDLSLDPFELVGFARNGALSKSTMRVFDRRSDGFWPGEGCGFVVLMRAAQARAEGRAVRTVIRGWGVSSDGQGGLTRPTTAGQAQALERAYSAAGFDAGTVPLFEAHGTGTAVGDPVEIAAIAAVRRAAGAQFPAAIGSIKANIGHTKAAAGVAGLIKQVMALDRQILPAATACEEPHPILQEQAELVTTLAEARAWPAELPLRAGVSALGFGGINIHLALEAEGSVRRRSLKAVGDGPRRTLDAETRRQMRSAQDAELFVFAAADRAALRAAAAAFAALAPSLSRAEMADAAAALAARCGAGPERAMAVAAGPAELARRLALLLGRLDDATDAGIDADEGIGFGRGAAPRILFLFPGQAAPANLSGGAWRRRFEAVADLYRAEGCTGDGDAIGTQIAQPAITLASRAGLAVLAGLGLEGAAAIGHSLGELGALHWAGAYDGEVLQRLATGRGRAMAERCLGGGAMLALFAPSEVAVELIAGRDAVIACYNGPCDHVIAGGREDLAAIEARARSRGVGVQPLAVSHAFHSRFAAPAAEAVAALVGGETMGPLRRPAFSTVAGRRLGPEDDLHALLGRQVVAPVRFAEAWSAAAAEADLAIEVGPGHGLTRLAAALGGPPAIALDAGGESLGGLLLATGAAFVLGAPVVPAALFGDRFTRPFDLDRPRRFLANPCESAAAPAAGAGTGRVVPTAAVAAGPAMRDKTPLDALRGLLARRLDLAVEAIRPEHRLFADLHLNSISVGQIVGQAARALGLSPPASPTNYALATVAQAAAGLAGAMPSGADAGAAFPAGVDSWVRAFAPRFVPRPAAAGERGRWRWRVVAPARHPLTRIFEEDSCAAGAAAIALCLPEAPGLDALPLILEAGQAALEAGGDALLLVVQSGGGGAAAARCLSLERPDLRVAVVDLPFADPRAGGWLLDEAAAARPGYSENRYDAAGLRCSPTLELVDDLAARPPAGVLGPDDVLLVSGGGSGIGAECALAAARGSGARIAVIGRSSAGADAVRATMARFAAAGVEAAYEAADVCDSGAVARAAERLAGRLGPITALIHAAGVNRPLPLAGLDLATLSETVAVKVAGFANLVAAIGPARLKLAVGFSSIIARLGLPGETHYAVANEWLGKAIEAFAADHPQCRCLALEWSVWAGVGMGERLGVIEGLERLGVAALPLAPATAMFETLIARAPSSTALVVAGRFGTPATVDLPRGRRPGRFMERVAIDYPGVEIVAECRLDPLSDPYLDDHALAGSPLFPAVLGLEALVQAAAAVADGVLPEWLEAVEFRRPVVIGAEGGTLRIAALAHERGRIETVLRAEETGFLVDHFKAVARFGEAAVDDEPSAAPPGLAPVLDPGFLYDQLLFHRGRFRRVSGYDALSATRCIARIEPTRGDRWFPQRPSDDLRLGDPAIRDAALHALQACIPHRRILPVAVERIRLGHLDPALSYVVHGTERRRDGDRFTFDLQIRDEAGALVESWRGLELQAIESLAPTRGWPAALLGPLVERRLDELLPGAGLRIGLSEDTPSTTLLADLLGAGRPILHRADGRPEADQPVSAAHAGRLVLAATARGAVGCDIETVEPRGAAAWKDLLDERLWALAQTLAEGQPGGFEEGATRVWAVIEALKKAGASPAHAPLTIEHVAGDWAVLASGRYRAMSWAADVGAMAARVAGAVATQEQRDNARVQPAYGYRHVVGFGDTNLVGNVYFAHFVEWQGRCREMFLRDKAPSVAADLAAGLSLVTTHCSCEFLQELRAFDEVRLDMRLKEVRENRLELVFDYWCVRDGVEELVARGEQGVACLWAAETGRGRTAIPSGLVEALRPYAKGAIGGLFSNDPDIDADAAWHRISDAAE